MSDYLRNIAARGLGLTDVILPRLTSRFEPLSLEMHPAARLWEGDDVQASSPLAPDGSKSLGGIAESQTLNSRHSTDAFSGDAQTGTRPGIGGIPEGRRRYGEAGQAQPPSPKATSLTEQPADGQMPDTKPSILTNPGKPVLRPAKRLSEPKDAVPVSPPDQPNFNGARDEEISCPDDVPGSLTCSGGAADEVRLSTPEPSAQTSEVERTFDAEPVMPANHLSNPASIGMARPPVTRTIIAQPLVAARARRIDAGAAQSGSREEPAIQVTIGRIEVRATPSPARARSERREPPVMGLDEYLHKGGGRR